MTSIFIISAPSGSGKSTLVNKVRESVPGLEFSISYTTRQPRGKERNGVEYFFVGRQDFEAMIARDEFLEHANVFGNHYGTAKRFLVEAVEHHHDLLLDIDVQGAEQIKRTLPGAVSIFILPPDRKTLEMRLRDRGQDSEVVIERRLATAAREIENYGKYDYILVNDRLEDSTECLRSVILAERNRLAGTELSAADQKIEDRAESCRLERMRERVRPILNSFRKGGGAGGVG